MSDPFIAEVRMFPYTFTPRSWADCNGQLIAISQNTALFSLVGTTYGGNGQTTFGLPNLMGRAPIGAGNGPGLTSRVLGEQTGVENVTLLSTQIPSHSHGLPVFTAPADTNEPAGAVVARVGTAAFINSAPSTVLATSLSIVGAGQSHDNMMPSLVVRFCICTSGVYPSRN